MLPDLANILQAASLASIASEVLAIHVPSMLQEYHMGRLKIPDPAADSGMGMDGGDDNPNEIQFFPEMKLAVQNVFGVIFPGASDDMECCGYFNTDRISRISKMLSDMGDIDMLVLNMHTPGGAARGMQTASEALLELKRQRPSMQIYAYASDLCASAGYYLAASTDGIFTAPSAVIGSIGTIASLADSTGFWDKIGIKNILFTDGPLKALGHARFGVSEAQRTYMQGQVDQISAEFKGLVKSRRGCSDADMQGQLFEARRAPQTIADATNFPCLDDFLTACCSAAL